MTIESSITPTIGLQLQRRAEILKAIEAFQARRSGLAPNPVAAEQTMQKLGIDRRLGIKPTV